VTATDIVLDTIDRQGPLPVSEVLDVALYHPDFGFYESGGTAGRDDGDFLTSPEVGTLFGAVLARALDGWWTDLGQPDPYLVVEAGAGPGMLARTILAAEPECSHALRYVLVDRSAAQRARHRELALEEPALVLPPLDPVTGLVVSDAPSGPLVTSLAELPVVADTPVVVVANELLDNVPCDLAERAAGAWHEVRVTRSGAGLAEVQVPLDAPRTARLERLAPDAIEGARVPLQDNAGAWLFDALRAAGDRGRVVVFDYVAETAELASRPQDTWLRTYRGHGRGRGYLQDLGQQDVTCEVAVDQLRTLRAPVSDRTQQAWLKEWGIDQLVAEADTVWRERAPIGDLAALQARSRINEARALLDLEGLGAFRVLEWR
jgi:SAM-dependent MidA family methyltransferase